jgi:hypothetical protein
MTMRAQNILEVIRRMIREQELSGDEVSKLRIGMDAALRDRSG